MWHKNIKELKILRILSEKMSEIGCKLLEQLVTCEFNSPKASRLCKNPKMSFRRSEATEKSKQNQRFLRLLIL